MGGRFKRRIKCCQHPLIKGKFEQIRPTAKLTLKQRRMFAMVPRSQSVEQRKTMSFNWKLKMLKNIQEPGTP